MKKLLFYVLILAFASCGNKKKDIDPELYEQGVAIAKHRIQKYNEEDVNTFLQGTNKNENVSLSIQDSILIVKIISKKGSDYTQIADFYHNLAHRSSVHVLGTQIRDSLTNKVLATCGYGFDRLDKKH